LRNLSLKHFQLVLHRLDVFDVQLPFVVNETIVQKIRGRLLQRVFELLDQLLICRIVIICLLHLLFVELAMLVEEFDVVKLVLDFLHLLPIG